MTAYTIGGAGPGFASRPYETVPEWSSTVPSRPAVAQDVLRQQSAALLQHAHRWLEATAKTAPQVLGVVPVLVAAVQLYEAQEYLACLNQIHVATNALQQARLAFPALPPL